MSINTTSLVTPTEGTSLVKAQAKVIDGFSLGNPEYTLTMIRVWYGTTARKEIIEECEKTWKNIEKLMTTENVVVGYTQHHSSAMGFQQNAILAERVMQFYFKVSILLYDNGFTEFMKVKPRVESRPTI